jgi:hypothetical protein
MTILLPLLFFATYLYLRKIWFQLRKVKTLAGIERLDLGFIRPDIILPEVRVKFKYYFQGGLYYGKGYLLVSDFLDGENYELYRDSNDLPVLEIGSQVVVSEEHIESYLTNRYPSVFVYIDPIEPYRFRLEGLNKTRSAEVYFES